MLRQRLRVRQFAFADALLRVIVVLAGLAAIWYGAMTILLALKLSPHTVNDISAYQTVFHRLASITAAGITGRVRVIVAVAGAICFLVLAPLVWRTLPRPYLARGELELPSAAGRGTTLVAPRAIERAAELAALEHPSIVAAAGRYGTDDVHVAVSVSRAGGLSDTLEAVRDRVADALVEHELPPVPVNVTLAGFDQRTRRELQ